MPHSELVQSVIRALDVLTLVAQSEAGLSLREICDALTLKQPTAHNLIRTLIARDFIEKTTAPVRYRLGAAVARLATERENHALLKRASAIMNTTLAQIRRTVPAKLGIYEEATLTFAQPVAGDVTMLLRLRVQRPGVLERPRHPFNPYQSAAALVFQAYWGPEELEQYRRRHPFAEYGASAWKTEDKLSAFLQHVRETGYALPPLYGPTQFRMAVPVFGPGQQIVAALGLGLWLNTTAPNRKALATAVVEAARKISAAPTAPTAVPPGGVL